MHVNFRKTGPRTLAEAAIVAALLSAGCSTIVNSGQQTVRRDSRKAQRMNPWVWGNAALAVFPPAALAGVVVDAYGGHWYKNVSLDEENGGSSDEENGGSSDEEKGGSSDEKNPSPRSSLDNPYDGLTNSPSSSTTAIRRPLLTK